MLYTVNVCKAFSEFQTITNQSWKKGWKNRSLPAVQTELVVVLADNELQMLMLLTFSSTANNDGPQCSHLEK